MQFDPTVGLGSLITLSVLLIGGVGAWYTLKSSVSTQAERLKELASQVDGDQGKHAAQHDDNLKRMAAIELQIARECVKKDDFMRFEDRVNTKFEKVEHTIKNSATVTVEAVKQAVGGMLRRGDRE